MNRRSAVLTFAAGFVAASLGEQVLRFETAAMAGVAAARAALEAWGAGVSASDAAR